MDGAVKAATAVNTATAAATIVISRSRIRPDTGPLPRKTSR
jgi:hypothetical protein